MFVAIEEGGNTGPGNVSRTLRLILRIYGFALQKAVVGIFYA